MIVRLLRRTCRRVLLGAAFAVAAFAAFGLTDTASAQLGGRGDRGYVGNSYLEIPGMAGDWRGPDHRGAIRFDAHYWRSNQAAMRGSQAQAQAANSQAGPSNPAAQAAAQAAQGRAPAGQAAQATAQAPRPNQAQGQNQGAARRPAIASLPGAPRSGEGTLVIALNKDSRMLPALMERCRNGMAIPEANYSVLAERSRSSQEIGPTPASVPEYFEYRLRDVRFVDCPIVESAPQQAIVVRFGDIEWLNWSNEAAASRLRSNLPRSRRCRAADRRDKSMGFDVVRDGQ